MRKFFTILGRLFAVLFAILFVVTAVAALVLFNLERKVFNAQTYKQALANQNFYEQMPAVISRALASQGSLNLCESNLIACGAGERSAEAIACFEGALGAQTYEQIASNQRTPTEAELLIADACLEQYGLDEPPAAEGGPPAYMTNLSADDWEFIISSLLPPEDLKSMTDEALDSLFAFINGKTDSATLSLIPLKTRLTSESGVNLVITMMESQPACTEAQLIEMGISRMGEAKIEMCNPPPEVANLIKPIIQAQLSSTVAGLPDQVTLIPTPPSVEDDPRGPLMGIRLGMRLSPLIPLLFLLGITLLVVRSLKEWLHWWGIPSLIAGLLVGIAGWISSSIIGVFIQSRVLSKVPANMPAIVAESASNLITALAKQMIKPVIWQGFLLAAIGLAMLVFAYFDTRRQNAAAVQHSEAETII